MELAEETHKSFEELFNTDEEADREEGAFVIPKWCSLVNYAMRHLSADGLIYTPDGLVCGLVNNNEKARNCGNFTFTSHHAVMSLLKLPYSETDRYIEFLLRAKAMNVIEEVSPTAVEIIGKARTKLQVTDLLSKSYAISKWCDAFTYIERDCSVDDLGYLADECHAEIGKVLSEREIGRKEVKINSEEALRASYMLDLEGPSNDTAFKLMKAQLIMLGLLDDFEGELTLLSKNNARYFQFVDFFQRATIIPFITKNPSRVEPTIIEKIKALPELKKRIANSQIN